MTPYVRNGMTCRLDRLPAGATLWNSIHPDRSYLIVVATETCLYAGLLIALLLPIPLVNTFPKADWLDDSLPRHVRDDDLQLRLANLLTTLVNRSPPAAFS